MASVVYYSGFSAITGIYLLLFCPPNYCESHGSSSTELPLDVCVELPLKCVAEIDQFQGEPDCTKLESALKCLTNVLELCDENVAVRGSTDEHVFDISQSEGGQKVNSSNLIQSNVTYIPDPDIEMISYLVHSTHQEFQQKCPTHNSHSNSSASSQTCLLQVVWFVCLVVGLYRTGTNAYLWV